MAAAALVLWQRGPFPPLCVADAVHRTLFGGAGLSARASSTARSALLGRAIPRQPRRRRQRPSRCALRWMSLWVGAPRRRVGGVAAAAGGGDEALRRPLNVAMALSRPLRRLRWRALADDAAAAAGAPGEAGAGSGNTYAAVSSAAAVATLVPSSPSRSTRRRCATRVRGARRDRRRRAAKVARRRQPWIESPITTAGVARRVAARRWIAGSSRTGRHSLLGDGSADARRRRRRDRRRRRLVSAIVRWSCLVVLLCARREPLLRRRGVAPILLRCAQLVRSRRGLFAPGWAMPPHLLHEPGGRAPRPRLRERLGLSTAPRSHSPPVGVPSAPLFGGGRRIGGIAPAVLCGPPSTPALRRRCAKWHAPAARRQRRSRACAAAVVARRPPPDRAGIDGMTVGGVGWACAVGVGLLATLDQLAFNAGAQLAPAGLGDAHHRRARRLRPVLLLSGRRRALPRRRRASPARRWGRAAQAACAQRRRLVAQPNGRTVAWFGRWRRRIFLGRPAGATIQTPRRRGGWCEKLSIVMM